MDDEWDDDAGSTAVVNGFGDASTENSKSFGRGRGTQNNNSGWAPQSSGDGGKSGGGGGSRACFKCGEEGHMSRDCPSGGGGGGGSRACFKCGEEGHMSRECPTGGGGGGGGSRACFKCGEEGHMSRECPTGGGGGGGGSRACFKCGEEGHMSRECPQGGGGGGGEGEDGDKPRPPIYIPPPPPEDEKELFESVQSGINFNKYDAIAVEITGEPPTPKPILTFDDAKLPETIRSNVTKAKYEKPTPVQKYSIPVVYADRDLMACAQTGSGKTAAFLLPVLSKIIENGLESGAFIDKQQPQVIIVGPTRELIIQIHKEALKFAHSTIVKPVLAYGGTSVGHQLNLLSRGCNMLIATPGRLMDFINRGKVGLEKLQYLILDEADRMLDMGFESEIRRLVGSPGIPDKMERHTLMFSATFPDEVQKLAQDFLQPNYIYLTVGRVGGACTDVTQSLVQLDASDKRKTLMDILAGVGESRSRTLVFVDTKRNADYLACYLSQEEIPTTSIHGDRLQREREEALRDFKSGQFPVLIATSVAARGLDIPKVEHVVNYDLPTEIDEYVHRIGRTGRCGNLGKATSFYCHEKDNAMARSLVKVLADALQDVPDWLEECADSAIGTSFGPKGGDFGGRDARRGGGGGGGGSRDKGDCDYNDGGGFGGGGDDEWD